MFFRVDMYMASGLRYHRPCRQPQSSPTARYKYSTSMFTLNVWTTLFRFALSEGTSVLREGRRVHTSS